jgi:hypothetical protein
MTFDHQPFFCEENVWRLCARDDLDIDFRWVLFITNPSKTCAFWRQRAAEDPDQPIVWDYHVVAIAAGDDGPVVWDLDCTFGVSLAFDVWVRVSFPYLGRLPEEYEPVFLLHEVDRFVDEFASDRSHMVDADGRPYHPFPQWDAIGEGHNLDRWMDLDSHPGLALEDLKTYVETACKAPRPT